jgi:DNA invertase Pin-like site-specific DNA recombinase
LIGPLIALCGALALALLLALAPRNRANRAGRRTEDFVEPLAPTPIRAAGPHGLAAIEDEDHDRSPDASEPAEPVAAAGSPQAGSAPRDHAARGRLAGSGAAVIGYVAVGEQERLANGESYAAQAEAIETFCRRRGLRLVRIVRDVESEGTRPAPAPGLQHACQALARGDARGLVVQGLGRLTHSPARLALLLRWLADADRALVAIENELDTSTMAGRKTAEALIEVGDWDREFAQRRAHNRAETRATGRPAVRDVPELHARIAAMREQGLSLHAIADTLNAEGVPTLRGGSYWRPSSVQAAVGYKRPTARTGNTGLTLPEPPSAAAAEEVER